MDEFQRFIDDRISSENGELYRHRSELEELDSRIRVEKATALCDAWRCACLPGLECYADSWSDTTSDGWISDTIAILLIVGIPIGMVVLMFILSVVELVRILL